MGTRHPRRDTRAAYSRARVPLCKSEAAAHASVISRGSMRHHMHCGYGVQVGHDNIWHGTLAGSAQQRQTTRAIVDESQCAQVDNVHSVRQHLRHPESTPNSKPIWNHEFYDAGCFMKLLSAAECSSSQPRQHGSCGTRGLCSAKVTCDAAALHACAPGRWRPRARRPRTPSRRRPLPCMLLRSQQEVRQARACTHACLRFISIPAAKQANGGVTHQRSRLVPCPPRARSRPPDRRRASRDLRHVAITITSPCSFVNGARLVIMLGNPRHVVKAPSDALGQQLGDGGQHHMQHWHTAQERCQPCKRLLCASSPAPRSCGAGATCRGQTAVRPGPAVRGRQRRPWIARR